jgi:hypothetical protein
MGEPVEQGAGETLKAKVGGPVIKRQRSPIPHNPLPA